MEQGKLEVHTQHDGVNGGMEVWMDGWRDEWVGRGPLLTEY